MRISQIGKPVIAQVQGVASANGAGLVAAADLAVMAHNARMGLTAIDVGLNCVVPIVPVSRSVGRKRDLEYQKSFAYMNEAFARLCSTDDAKEGVSAFFKKACT